MVTEESTWGKTKGKSGYAISKFRSEMEVWRGMEQGLNAVIVNPSVIVGPGKWDSGSGLIFGTIAKGFPFYTNGVTGYVDVRDVVDAMIIAMVKELWGKRFLINGENLSHKDFFTSIAHEMGKKPPHIEAKPWMNHIAVPLNWVVSKLRSKEATLTRDTARSGQSKTYYSAALAEKTLGIKFRKISDAVTNTVRTGSL
jgi:nucleoside-diphosphate-sugar epimerase